MSKHVQATRGKPQFIVVCVDNALCQELSNLAAKLQVAFKGAGWIIPPVATLMAHMKNEATQTELNKNANVVICTPGKLLEMHDRSQVNIQAAKKIMFDQADCLFTYAEDDHIRSIASKLQPGQHVIALTSRSTPLLQQRWRDYAPAQFMQIKDMIQLHDTRSDVTIKKMSKFIGWCDLNKQEDSKVVYAARRMHRLHAKTNRAVLGIANWKVTVDAVKDAGRKILPGDFARHRAELVDPDERYRSLSGFKDSTYKIMISTRRSIYGASFDFLPVLVLVDVPDTYDELLYILQWYVTWTINIVSGLLTMVLGTTVSEQSSKRLRKRPATMCQPYLE